MCGPGDTVIQRFDITKGHVISKMSKVYDPLGLVAPVSQHSVLQKLWTAELGWDHTLPVIMSRAGRDSPHTLTTV